MVSTIQVSKEIKQALEKQKFSQSETYEDVIWDLLEDRITLSKEAQEAILAGEEEIKNKQTITLSALKKKYGFK